MRKLKGLIIILMLFSLRSAAQHNSDYIQYMFNGLLINPAYAGSQDALNITAMYRKQWVGLNGAPVSAMLTAHSPLKNKKLNLGITLVNDKFGVYNHTKADIIYAYRVKIFNGKLSLGLQGGVDSYTTDWNRVNTSESGDPNFVASAMRKIIPEAGVGAYYHSKNFYIGVAVPDLFYNGLNKFFMTTLTTGFVYKVNSDFRIKPAVLIKYIKGSPLAPNVSTTFYYKDVVGLGLGYTYSNSAMIYADIKINGQLNFGYGYAYMLNALNAYTFGTHEIMLRYLFRYKINAVSARYF